MSAETSTETSAEATPTETTYDRIAQAEEEAALAMWEAHKPPTDLIFDDGEPLESNRHRIAMNVLIRSLQHVWRDRDDFFTGGNMFVYYCREQTQKREFRGPDFFVVLDVDGTRSRQGWVVWNEGGRYPDVIVELISPSTARVDRIDKKDLYQNVFKTREYFLFDPFKPDSLQGWRLDGALRYEPIPAGDRGWLWCNTLGFWLGTWEGTVTREPAIWLRFYDREGNLVLLPEEDAQQQAETERQRAEAAQQQAETERQQAEAAQQQAEAAQQQAEAAQQQAEAERQQAEAERQQAETERQRAEAERQRAERLAERLKALGEDPATYG